MSQVQADFLTTREAAERLQVHARTVRKWIDVFEDYICPDLNERGHYMLTEDSLDRLLDIKERLQESNKSMKQVREELIFEEKLPHSIAHSSESMWTHDEGNDQAMHQMMQSMNQVGTFMEELFDRMDRLEDHMFTIFETFEDVEKKLISLQYDRVSGNEVHQMFDEIRKKQDQLKMELRNVHFTQRLTAATKEQAEYVPRRQKKNKFLFFF